MKKRRMAMLLAIAAAGCAVLPAAAEEKVSVTLPAYLMAELELEDITDEGIEIVAENEDGSVTIAMSAEQQMDLQYEMKEEIESGIEDILEEDVLSAVTDITYNYDMTVFQMKVAPELYTGLEVYYGAAFYIYGNLYQIISGVPQEEISTEVRIVDQDTGDVLETADSAMMEEILGLAGLSQGQSGVEETEITQPETELVLYPAETEEVREDDRISQLEQENLQLRKYIQELESQIAALTAGTAVPENTVYGAGEAWVVEGQWSFTINSVTTTQERSEYTDKNPVQVVIIDYTYENLGYTDEIMGLYFTMSSVVDETGELAEYYPADVDKYPMETPVGARCVGAQEGYGLNNESSRVRIYVDQYDSNGQKQSAVFEVAVS